MKLPLSLLRRRLSGPWTVSDLAAALARSGLELESAERHAPGMERVVTGLIRTTEPHPQADRLRVCAVDAGPRGSLVIVTAATNVQAGDIVPVALSEAVLPTGKTIVESKMRGVVSQGMFCSVEELGLGVAAEGVWVLPAGTPLGCPVAEAMDLGEVVLDLAVPANRADLLSAHGVARELAGLGLGEAVGIPDVTTGGEGAGSPLLVEVASEGVLAYSVVELAGLEVGPSPAEVVRCLEAAGMRAVNAVVDVTNMILLEFGQPMHAFDRARIRGDRLEAREARPGDRLTLLDGRTVEPVGLDLVIADAEGPLALAGVMGGESSGVTEATTAVVLEVASFLPERVRTMARRHGVASESSARFSRGVDHQALPALLAEAVRRIVAACGGLAARVVVARPPSPLSGTGIRFRPGRSSALLGLDLEASVQEKSLREIGCAVESEGDMHWTVKPPSWRCHDLVREVDLIEEIACRVGLDAIPAVLPPLPLAMRVPLADSAGRIRSWAQDQGLDEVVLSSLVREGHEGPFRAGDAVRVAEPMGDYQQFRQSLLPGLLDLAARRRRDGVGRVAVFEIGTVVHEREGRTIEDRRLALLVAGSLETGPFLEAPDAMRPDVRWAQGLAVSLVSLFRPGTELTWQPVHREGLQPGRTAVALEGACLVGELHPAMLEGLGMVGWARVVLLEVSVAALEAAGAEQAGREYRAFDRLPSASRDLALLIRDDVPAAEVVRAVRDAAGPALRSLRVFDRYKGPGVPDGHASLALSLSFGASDRTLQDAEVEAIEQNLLTSLAGSLGAVRRG